MMNRWPPPFSFVLQLPGDADIEAGRFAGRVEHVVSGRSVRFSSLEELRGFIAETIADVRSAEGAGDQDSSPAGPSSAGD
jgi:hypothetical protein